MAGSIIGGLVGAVVVVVGPLAGAQEHVLTGSVLLVFAAAWATLAVLSERWTDQPQRWAFVPAALMGFTGVSILALAPTGNESGWVWPPVAAALAVWIIVRARRDLRSRTRTWLLYPVCGALLLSAVGGGYEMYRETADTNYPMPGRLVDVGGHKLHINCTGTGSPTVVLEPGLGEPSTAMAWIAPDVAATTRVCVYDRAGRGWSESAGAPQDGVQVATDLHTLLDRAGEHGPYVLAGHSAGGLYVLNFAQLYPDQVAGVALLDSMTPEQYTAIDGWPAFYEMYRRASAVLTPLSRLGVGHLIYDSAYGDLPAPARDQERAFMATPRAARSVRDEFSQIRTDHDRGPGPHHTRRSTAHRPDRGEGRPRRMDGRPGRTRRAVDQRRSSHAAERRARDAHRTPGDCRPISTGHPRRRHCRPHRHTLRRTGTLR